MAASRRRCIGEPELRLRSGSIPGAPSLTTQGVTHEDAWIDVDWDWTRPSAMDGSLGGVALAAAWADHGTRGGLATDMIGRM